MVCLSGHNYLASLLHHCVKHTDTSPNSMCLLFSVSVGRHAARSLNPFVPSLSLQWNNQVYKKDFFYCPCSVCTSLFLLLCVCLSLCVCVRVRVHIDTAVCQLHSSCEEHKEASVCGHTRTYTLRHIMLRVLRRLYSMAHARVLTSQLTTGTSPWVEGA